MLCGEHAAQVRSALVDRGMWKMAREMRDSTGSPMSLVLHLLYSRATPVSSNLVGHRWCPVCLLARESSLSDLHWVETSTEEIRNLLKPIVR